MGRQIRYSIGTGYMRRLSPSSNRPKHQPVFVVDFFEGVAFAFEARDLAQAEAFGLAPWFKHAVERAYSGKYGGWPDSNGTNRLVRAAKPDETTAYRDLAREFVEELARGSNREFEGGAQPLILKLT